MRELEQKNACFDRLSTNSHLRWLGENTSHVPLPPRVLAG